MKEIFGKSTINPLLFYAGKISGYFLWIIFVLRVFDIQFYQSYHYPILQLLSYLLFILGAVLVIISIVNLGNSVRMGLPYSKTALKIRGIYRFSRNPMYVGFDLWTLAAMMITMNPWILVLGLSNLIVYHLIILGEERFLEERFGQPYLEYKQKVRRYL